MPKVEELQWRDGTSVFENGVEYSKEEYEALQEQRQTKVTEKVVQSDEDPLGTKVWETTKKTLHNGWVDTPGWIKKSLISVGDFTSGVNGELKEEYESGNQSPNAFLGGVLTATEKLSAMAGNGAVNVLSDKEHPHNIGLNLNPELANLIGQSSFEIVKDAGITKGFSTLNKANFTTPNELSPSLAAVDGSLSPRVLGDDALIATKPYLEMTVDEAGEVYGKVRNKEIGAELTGAQRSADPDVTRIARKYHTDQLDDLTRRQHNSYTASAVGSDPVKYLTKYYESRGLKAEAHHILDHDFWGQALNSPNGQIAGEALWTKGVKSGNDAANLVSSWSAKTKGLDHQTLHRLYKSIDKRNLVSEMMDKGIWYKQSPEKQAIILREVADRQYRLTANFYRIKLAAIKRNNPKLLKLSPQQLKEELFKNPKKYAEINPLEGYNLKDPDIIKIFNQQLNAIPNSGKVTEEMKVVFGLDIPKAGAKEWKGTANQKRFDLTIGPLTKRISRNKTKIALK